MTRPFKVLGVQQIAIGGRDKGRLQKLWADLPSHTKGTDHAPEVDRKSANIEAALAKAKSRQVPKT